MPRIKTKVIDSNRHMGAAPLTVLEHSKHCSGILCNGVHTVFCIAKCLKWSVPSRTAPNHRQIFNVEGHQILPILFSELEEDTITATDNCVFFLNI
jgi:hypothetical protein